MKKSYDIEDPKKQTKAAAEHFESTNSMAPPSFSQTASLSSQATVNNQIPADETSSNEVESQHQHGTEEQTDTRFFSTITPHKLFQSVVYGHQIFKQGSTLTSGNINGAKVHAPPGCMQGPNVKSLIYADLASEIDTPPNRIMAKAVSKVLGKFLDEWRKGFHLPNVAWYPAYHYFPGPVAPPMPNLPTPLSAIPSIFEFYLTHKRNMIEEIFRELPSEMDNDVNRNTVEVFSEKTVTYFEQWLNNKYIVNVIGQGIVPDFMPPFRFGGRVKGITLPKPSVLS